MAEVLSSSVKVITDPEAIEVLFGLTYSPALTLFFKSPQSIAAVAQETAMKANTLYRWVQKWCALGLLEVAATQPKRGRPTYLYKTTAERFFVPFAATPAPTHEALLSRMDRGFQEQFFRSLVKVRRDMSPDWGFSFSLEGSGTYLMRTYKDAETPLDPRLPNEPATVSAWNTELYLTFEEAKALQEQLYCFWHSREKRPGTRRYLIQLRLAPAAD